MRIGHSDVQHLAECYWLSGFPLPSLPGEATPLRLDTWREEGPRPWTAPVTALDCTLPCAHLDPVDAFLDAAIDEARQGLAEGGIPIGSVLVIGGRVVGRGHNRRVQRGSAVLHAEMDCLENAGRLRADDYRQATLYSTLSPCDMCSGATLLYGIPRVVIGENRTFSGPEAYLAARGVEVTIADDQRCVQLMRDFIAARPDLWNEDIGV